MSLQRASGVVQVGSHQIRIPRTGTVADLLGELRKRVDLSRPDAELRVVEVIMSKIFKVGQQDPRCCRSRLLPDRRTARPCTLSSRSSRLAQPPVPGLRVPSCSAVCMGSLAVCLLAGSVPLVAPFLTRAVPGRSCPRKTLWTRSATSTGRFGRRRCRRRSGKQGRRTACCTSTTSGETSSTRTRSAYTPPEKYCRTARCLAGRNC
jgi:hypothetical protein